MCQAGAPVEGAEGEEEFYEAEEGNCTCEVGVRVG
jgi:hypothetical protein